MIRKRGCKTNFPEVHCHRYEFLYPNITMQDDENKTFDPISIATSMQYK